MKNYKELLQYIIIFIIRVGSGGYIFVQGWEKLTGGFTINGLVPVVIKNEDSPEWFKFFFEHIVANTTGIFNFVVPLGEIAIGLGLMFGILSHVASFFGAFVMLNYILSDMIFTYPVQLAFFIILLMNVDTLKKLSLKYMILYIREKGDYKHETHPARRR